MNGETQMGRGEIYSAGDGNHTPARPHELAAWNTVERHGQPPKGAWVRSGSGELMRATGAGQLWTDERRWLPAEAIVLPPLDRIAPAPTPATVTIPWSAAETLAYTSEDDDMVRVLETAMDAARSGEAT